MEDSLVDRTTGWSALLATLFHLTLLALPLLPEGCDPEADPEPARPSEDTAATAALEPTEQMQVVQQLPPEALEPEPAALSAAPEPLPELDLADLPPLDDATGQAIAAAAARAPAKASQDGAGADRGGDVSTAIASPVAQAAEVALRAGLPAQRSAQEVDGELRQWQEAVEVLDRVFFRRLWLRQWKPQYADQVTVGRICVRVTVDQHERITDFAMISGTGIAELDARIELAFKGARKPFGLSRIDGEASRPVWLTLE
ncbi:MAG: hypothetical protein ACOCZK_02990 [Planctomycetota bacterium]